MSCQKAIYNYDNPCCQSRQIRAAHPTGIVQNGYVRRADGRFISVDGLDLTSGYASRSLLAPNGSKAASAIFDKNERPLCCN
jgi:hypothetical protein